MLKDHVYFTFELFIFLPSETFCDNKYHNLLMSYVQRHLLNLMISLPGLLMKRCHFWQYEKVWKNTMRHLKFYRSLSYHFSDLLFSDQKNPRVYLMSLHSILPCILVVPHCFSSKSRSSCFCSLTSVFKVQQHSKVQGSTRNIIWKEFYMKHF